MRREHHGSRLLSPAYTQRHNRLSTGRLMRICVILCIVICKYMPCTYLSAAAGFPLHGTSTPTSCRNVFSQRYRNVDPRRMKCSAQTHSPKERKKKKKKRETFLGRLHGILVFIRGAPCQTLFLCRRAPARQVHGDSGRASWPAQPARRLV